MTWLYRDVLLFISSIKDLSKQAFLHFRFFELHLVGKQDVPVSYFSVLVTFLKMRDAKYRITGVLLYPNYKML